jgi:membrane associated rhomboid family serine protease
MLDFSTTPVTLILLILNVMVSLYAMYMDPSLLDRFAFKPVAVLRQNQWYRMITGGFLHVGIGHLAFNMITLFFFGPLLETILGSVNFVILYFGAELAAHAVTLAIHHSSETYAAVGASGAVSGVVFAFCLFFPFEMLYIFFALPMPALLFAVLYVAGSIYAMKQRDAGMTGGIAHEAHLGGALGGVLLTILLEPRSIMIFLEQIGLG